MTQLSHAADIDSMELWSSEHLNLPERKFVTVRELGAMLLEPRFFELWSYGSEIRKYVSKKLTYCEYFLFPRGMDFQDCSGALYDVFESSFGDFLDEVPIFYPDASFAFLPQKFWTDFADDVGSEVCDRLASFQDTIVGNLEASLFLVVASVFMHPQDQDAIRALDGMWLEGHYPIGLDGDKALIVLCA